MIYNDQQKEAIKLVSKWYNEWYTSRKKEKQVFYLGGYAGTGKSTLAIHFANNSKGDVTFGAFTGKAALNLRKKGCAGAKTIHSLIYIAEVDEETGEVEFRLNKTESSILDTSLIIIDECSMVDEQLGRDLLSFNKPILVLGDPGQLPPPNGAGFFTNKKPDFMLTEIHRQARDNPIIYMATEVRNGRHLDHGTYGDSLVLEKPKMSDILTYDQVLCGRNVTRVTMNSKIRKAKNIYDEMPTINESLICLKNDKEKGIFNGGMFTVKDILQSKYKTNFLYMNLLSEDFDHNSLLTVKVHKSFFMDEIPKPEYKTLKDSQEFDFGYSITVHKSQGSQWDNVYLFDESYCFRDDKWKWLYTGITRAASKLIMIRN